MQLTNQAVTRGAALFFGCVGLYCVYVGSTHQYYDRLGPGPGFFPIWIGLLLALLSAALIVQSFRQHAAAQDGEAPASSSGDTSLEGAPFFQSRDAAFRLAGIAGALTLVCGFLDLLGFRLTILAFTAFAPFLIDRQPLLRSLLVALFCGFGIAYGFENWLGVQLPKSSIGALRDLGM